MNEEVIHFMQTAEAIELYNEVLEVVNEGDDVTIKKDRNGKLVVYSCSIKKHKKKSRNNVRYPS